MNYCIGLTGGIGCGKTTAANYFASLGIFVIDADVVAREVVEPGTPALEQIIEHFGADIVLPTGGLDRAKLRTIIFGNPAHKTWLESLLHPLIFSHMRNSLERATSAYAIWVSPLVWEMQQAAGVFALPCNRILVIDVPQEMQLARTITRDKESEAQIRAIINCQVTREERIRHADDVLDNSVSMAELYSSIDKLHAQYLNYASATKEQGMKEKK